MRDFGGYRRGKEKSKVEVQLIGHQPSTCY